MSRPGTVPSQGSPPGRCLVLPRPLVPRAPSGCRRPIVCAPHGPFCCLPRSCRHFSSCLECSPSESAFRGSLSLPIVNIERSCALSTPSTPLPVCSDWWLSLVVWASRSPLPSAWEAGTLHRRAGWQAGEMGEANLGGPSLCWPEAEQDCLLSPQGLRPPGTPPGHHHPLSWF